LFRSTRGQIILLLREKQRTVAELAEATGLTDNAIRAHLATLERDGLVHQSGERAGFRKPHFAYELTAEADQLFPKAYGPVLNRLLTVLKERLGSRKTESTLREVGRRVASSHVPARYMSLKDRLNLAVEILGSLGGHAFVARENGTILIRGAGCPLAMATSDHPEVCEMLETLLAEITGVPVRQKCKRGRTPQCCFEIKPVKRRKK